jgi:NAD(P)H-dependent FMN reductase
MMQRLVTPLRILAISGSLRAQSSNTVLLRAAAELAPATMRIDLFAGLDALPHFNPDLDGPKPAAAVRRLRTSIDRADALLICSPEYAHGVPGSLKNALDWLVSGIEIVEKPVGVLNASPRSTHAHASLTETLRTMAAAVVDDASRTVPLSGRGVDVAAILARAEWVDEVQMALDALARAADHHRRERRARSRARD